MNVCLKIKGRVAANIFVANHFLQMEPLSSAMLTTKVLLLN